MCRDRYVIISFPNGYTYRVPLRVLVYFTKGSSVIDNFLNNGSLDEAIDAYKDTFSIGSELSKISISWKTLQPYASLVTSPDSDCFDLKTATITLED
jgi:hypothetical protein